MILLAYIIAVIATFYVTRVLLYADVDSHAGPFPQMNQTVVHVQPGTDDDDFTFYQHRQPVTLFDYFRRIFGLYDIVQAEDDPAAKLWYIRQTRLEVWTCPTCLSFWVSIPLSFLSAAGTEMPLPMFLVFILATAGGSVIVTHFVDLLEEGMPYFTVNVPGNYAVNDASQDGDYDPESYS